MKLRIRPYNFLGIYAMVGLFLIGATVLMNFKYGFEFRSVAIFSTVFLVQQLIPIIFYACTYYSISSDVLFEVKSNSITIIRNGNTYSIRNNEIDRIIMYKSGTNARTAAIPLSGIDFFHYAQVVLKNNKEVIITSLFAEHVDEVLEKMDGVTIEYSWGLPNLSRREKLEPFLPAEHDKPVE